MRNPYISAAMRPRYRGRIASVPNRYVREHLERRRVLRHSDLNTDLVDGAWGHWIRHCGAPPERIWIDEVTHYHPIDGPASTLVWITRHGGVMEAYIPGDQIQNIVDDAKDPGLVGWPTQYPWREKPA